MRSNFKTVILLALAAVISFASCSKSGDEPKLNGDTYSVNVSITGAVVGEAVRGVGDHIETGTAVTFNGGHLFFATANGTITKHITITSGSEALNNDVVGIQALDQQTVTVANVNAMSKKAYLVGNLDNVGTPTNINDVLAMAVTVKSQADAEGNVKNVTLWGEGTIDPISGQENKMKTEFNVSPINSRLEVGKLTASGNITDYKVEGIFINNYYDKMTLSATAESADLKDNKNTVANYEGGAGSYTAELDKVVYDYAAAGIGNKSGLSLLPDDKTDGTRVWGYNLLVSKTPASPSPQIIVRISGVKLGADVTSFPGTYFLTIQPKKGGADLELAAANVYRIPEISFTESDLGEEPYKKPISVDVKITMLEWTSTDIDYTLNP